MKTSLCIIICILTSLIAFSQSAIIITDLNHYIAKPNKLKLSCLQDIQINNRDGESYGDVYIPYSKGDKVSIDYIQIEDMDGNIIRKIKEKEMTISSSIANITSTKRFYPIVVELFFCS